MAVVVAIGMAFVFQDGDNIDSAFRAGIQAKQARTQYFLSAFVS